MNIARTKFKSVLAAAVLAACFGIAARPVHRFRARRAHQLDARHGLQQIQDPIAGSPFRARSNPNQILDAQIKQSIDQQWRPRVSRKRTRKTPTLDLAIKPA